MAVCCFFDHKDTPPSLYPPIKGSIEKLILYRAIDRFMVGDQGGFDEMVLKALRVFGIVQQERSNGCLTGDGGCAILA